MAEQNTVRTVLKFLLEGGDVPADVAKRLEQLGQKAKVAQQDLKGTSGAVKDLAGQLSSYLGAAAVGAFVKSAVSDFATLERTLNATSDQMTRMGLDGGRAIQGVRRDLEALAAGGGPLVSETLPGFQKFLGITQDVGAAMAATKLAADASERGTLEYGAAMDAVAQLIQGRPMGAAMALNLQLRDQSGRLKTNAELMQEVVAAVGGLGDAFQDTQNKLDQAGAGWERFKTKAGEGLSVLAGWAAKGLGALTTYAQDLGAWYGFVVNGALDVARNLGEIFSAAFDLKKLATDPGQWWADLGAAGKKVTDDLALSWQTLTEQIAENHRDIGKDAATTATDLEKLLAQARKKAAAEQAEEDKKNAEKRMEYEARAALALEAAKVKATEEGSQARLDAMLEALRVEHEQRLAEARKLNADLATEDQRYALERLALINQFHAAWLAIEAENAKARADAEQEAFLERLAERREQAGLAVEAEGEREDAERDARYADLLDRAGAFQDQLAALDAEALDTRRERELAAVDAEWEDARNRALEGDAAAAEELNNTQRWEDRKAAVEARYAGDRKALEKGVKEFKRQQMMEGAQLAIASLRTIFGNSKGFAIAEAIMNTYQGATRALKDYPQPYASIVAALTIAAGMKQVAEIRKQQPTEGKGFDDPANDRLAYLGGRKWATDLVAMVGRGFQEGVNLSMAGMARGPSADVRMPDSPAPAPAVVQAPGISRTVEAGPRVALNVGVLVADEESLRQLNRELDRVAARDENRLVG